jgi:hypothetical protein
LCLEVSNHPDECGFCQTKFADFSYRLLRYW